MTKRTPAGPGLRPALPLLVAGFVILFVVVGGGIDTVSVFLNALAESEGWSHKVLSAAISVGAVSAALSTPLVGLLVDRYGVRLPMALGVVLLGAGFAVLTGMTEPWHFVAANLLLGPGFASCALLPITLAVTIVVPDRKALALGIVGVGSSAGALVLAPALQGVIDAAGWRSTYLLLGAMIVLTPIPFLLFALPRGRLQRDVVGRPKASPASRPSLAQELRRPGVLELCGIMVVPGVVSFGIQVHVVPFLSDHGHSTAFAAAALGATIGISAFGKLGGGFLGDRLGVLATLRLALAAQTVAIGILPLASSPLVASLFVAVHGLAVGTEIAVLPVIALGILGSERFGTLYGLLQLVAMLTIGLAPLVPGLIFDATGSYAGAVAFWFGTMLLALLVVGRLRLPARGEPRVPSAASAVDPSPAPTAE